MQKDFHYYATYTAAFLAGYSAEESRQICYACMFTDHCTEMLLGAIGAPVAAATTQLQSEMINAPNTILSRQNITRIWSSFHFLPYDLNAEVPKCSRNYRNKYRLICKPNGSLVADTAELAKNNGSLQAAGLAAHIIADTWAHAYFAGTPSYVINNTSSWFYEILEENGKESERKIAFLHSVGDNIEKASYVCTPPTNKENSIFNLGHGRAGHLPDMSFIRYKYLPAWGKYESVTKDNPSDYYHAFCQLIHLFKYLRGECDSFRLGYYEEDPVLPWKEDIDTVFRKPQPDPCDDWAALVEKITGARIADFDMDEYRNQYMDAAGPDKDNTHAGQYFLAAMAHKSMVTNKIYKSGNMLAGYSVEYKTSGFHGIKEYSRLLTLMKGGPKDEQR
ncbi:MAG: hypothetical protein HUJ76_05960 [Parasporobacterium sp.]|nr:hypothetical protein [Parasporobacterium sp.]